MLKKLKDIYNHTNDVLLGGALNSINDVIEHYEEFQQRINEMYPLEAPKLTITLNSNQITKPSDFLYLSKIVIDKTEVTPDEMWSNIITLPERYKEGTADIYYYKKVTPLDPLNMDQVPDIDQRYLPSMAKYAAELYWLIDDDGDMRDAFKEAFFDGLNSIGNVNKNNQRSNFKNLW